MRSIFMAALVVASVGQPSLAAEKTLSWDDSVCRYRLHFDPTKISEVSLWNTIHLIFGPQDFSPLCSHANPESR